MLFGQLGSLFISLSLSLICNGMFYWFLSSYPGTRLRFHRGLNKEWQEAEDLGDSDDESDDERRMPFTSLKVAKRPANPSQFCFSLCLMRYEHTLLIVRSDMIGWVSSVTTFSPVVDWFTELWFWRSEVSGPWGQCVLRPGRPQTHLWPRLARRRPVNGRVQIWSPLLCEKQR